RQPEQAMCVGLPRERDSGAGTGRLECPRRRRPRAGYGLPGETAIGFEFGDLARGGAANKFAGRSEGCPDAHWSSGRLVRLPLAGDVLRAVLDVANVGEYLFHRTMDRDGPLDLDHGLTYSRRAPERVGLLECARVARMRWFVSMSRAPLLRVMRPSGLVRCRWSGRRQITQIIE